MTQPASDIPGELHAPPGGEENAANVAGRAPAYPDSGFGRLWSKDISLRLARDIEPGELMRVMKTRLSSLWPRRGAFYQPIRGIREGEVAGVDVGVGPVTLSTGVVVAESTATSFTLLSPEGHMFAGWNRFSVEREADGVVVSLEIVMRASDPLYELGLGFGGHRSEERFWAEFLWNVAALYGERPPVRVRRRLLSRRRQWNRWTNIARNAAIRTAMRRARSLLRLPKRGTA